MDLEGNFMLPWAEYDAGLLGEDGMAVRKCSTDFLASLYKACLDTYRVDEQQLPPDESKPLLEYVIRELNRLVTYPSLFPDSTAHVRFLEFLEHGISTMIKKRKDNTRQVAVNGFRLRANVYATQEEQILQKMNRPTFKPNLKPWEQFLLKGSPGSGVVLPPVPPNGYVQMMPIGGVALHLRWLRHTQVLEKEFRESNVTVSTPTKRKRSEEEESTESSFKAILNPSKNVTYRNNWIALTPNPYYERRMPIAKHNRIVDRLESFNAVIERLEDDDLTNYNGQLAGVRAMFYRTIVTDMV